MAISGNLRELDLVRLIEITCQEGNQARLSINREGEEAILFFAGGNLVHAAIGARQGEEVIYELMGWKEGDFELEQDVPSPAVTIETPWSALVLEGLCRIDESRMEATPEEFTEEPEFSELELELEEQQEETEEVVNLAKLDDVLKEMAGEMPGLLATSVVGMDGIPLAHYVTGKFDAETASAQFALVMSLSKRVAAKMGLGGVQENLVTTKNAYMLTRFLGEGNYWLGVAMTKSGSLGGLRLVTQQYSDILWKALPGKRQA